MFTLDETTWNHRDYEIAAAVVGLQAAQLLRIIAETPDNGHVLRGVQNEEAARVAVWLARDAAHYANRAETEADKMARFLGVSVAQVNGRK